VNELCENSLCLHVHKKKNSNAVQDHHIFRNTRNMSWIMSRLTGMKSNKVVCVCVCVCVFVCVCILQGVATHLMNLCKSLLKFEHQLPFRRFLRILLSLFGNYLKHAEHHLTYFDAT